MVVVGVGCFLFCVVCCFLVCFCCGLFVLGLVGGLVVGLLVVWGCPWVRVVVWWVVGVWLGCSVGVCVVWVLGGGVGWGWWFGVPQGVCW